MQAPAYSGNCDGKDCAASLGVTTSIAGNVLSNAVGNRICHIRQRKATQAAVSSGTPFPLAAPECGSVCSDSKEVPPAGKEVPLSEPLWFGA
jgi:hypothetical protein